MSKLCWIVAALLAIAGLVPATQVVALAVSPNFVIAATMGEVVTALAIIVLVAMVVRLSRK